MDEPTSQLPKAGSVSSAGNATAPVSPVSSNRPSTCDGAALLRRPIIHAALCHASVARFAVRSARSVRPAAARYRPPGR